MYGLRDRILAAKNIGFLDLEIEGDSNVIIDCYNKKKSNLPSSIILLMEETQRLSQNLYIHNCNHVYREENRTTDYLAKKCIYNVDSNI